MSGEQQTEGYAPAMTVTANVGVPVVQPRSPVSHTVLYAYSQPNSPSHRGLIKVGDAKKLKWDGPGDPPQHLVDAEAERRIREQTSQAGVHWELEWARAVTNDSKEIFRDGKVHEFFKRQGFPKHRFPYKTGAQEWFEIDADKALKFVEALLRGEHELNVGGEQLTLRIEQQDFVRNTRAARDRGDSKRLWYAKMRFGKTPTAYGFIADTWKEPLTCQRIEQVLILTHRPVVVTSWYDDFGLLKAVDERWQFVSDTKGRAPADAVAGNPTVRFVSMQDLRGKDRKSKADFKAKNREIFEAKWGTVIIDEAHEGNDTELAREVYAELQPGAFMLHLSGTPFKALSGEEFTPEQVDTWDYLDEQRAKAEWNDADGDNPYDSLPKLWINTLDIRETVRQAHFKEEGDAAFEFNRFFKVTGGKFENEAEIVKFLDSLCAPDGSRGGYMPFSPEREELLRHTLWVLPSTQATKAMRALLAKHPFFKLYTVVNAAGSDKDRADDPVATQNALDDVLAAIDGKAKEGPGVTKTITLTVARLTTGVTVRPWTGVLMLRNTTSAEFYMQTIFRAQSPWYHDGKWKTDCYVWDFAPDRVLKVLTEAAGVNHRAGDERPFERKRYLTELLNFLPVLALTDANDLVAFTADGVVRELQKVFRERVVNDGFDSSYLFTRRMEALPADIKAAIEDVHRINGSYSSAPSTKEKPDPNVHIADNGLNEFSTATLKDDIAEIEQQLKDPPADWSASDFAAKQASKDARKKEIDQRENMRRILKTISVRLPYMLLGLMGDSTFRSQHLERNFTMAAFAQAIDDKSWSEFFGGVSKELFIRLESAFDIDVLQSSIQVWMEDCEAAYTLRAAGKFKEYGAAVRALMAKIKNPNKETVLTPWPVVERLYAAAGLPADDIVAWKALSPIASPAAFGKPYDAPKFYDINAKTGFFPLLAALQLQVATKRNWAQICNESIFANVRTPAAKWVVCALLGMPRDWENISVIDVVEELRSQQLDGLEEVWKQAFIVSKLLRAVKRASDSTDEEVLNRIRTARQLALGFVKQSGMDIESSEQYMSEESARLLAELSPEKFDFSISNPPYQEARSGTAAVGIYPTFVLLGSLISNTSIMIHPARAFSGAGRASKKEVSSIMQNEAFSLSAYEPNASNFFPSTDIKGGIAITKYQEGSNTPGAFSLFNLPQEAISILTKVKESDEASFSTLAKPYTSFKFSSKANQLYPELMSRLSLKDILATSVFSKLPEIFKTTGDEESHWKIIGRENAARTERWIDKELVESPLFDHWKVFIPKSNGSGLLGEPLSAPVMGSPVMGSTQTFLNIGPLVSQKEAQAVIKYVKSRFARLMLGTLKVTQDNPQRTWANVPLQDFTEHSSIDWSKSIAEIDAQLYAKYGLTKEEIAWVNNKVQEMV